MRFGVAERFNLLLIQFGQHEVVDVIPRPICTRHARRSDSFWWHERPELSAFVDRHAPLHNCRRTVARIGRSRRDPGFKVRDHLRRQFLIGRHRGNTRVMAQRLQQQTLAWFTRHDCRPSVAPFEQPRARINRQHSLQFPARRSSSRMALIALSHQHRANLLLEELDLFRRNLIARQRSSGDSEIRQDARDNDHTMQHRTSHSTLPRLHDSNHRLCLSPDYHSDTFSTKPRQKNFNLRADQLLLQLGGSLLMLSPRGFLQCLCDVCGDGVRRGKTNRIALGDRGVNHA